MSIISEKNRSASATFAILGAGILWGCISLLVRRLSAGGFDPMQVAFVRLLCASILLTAWTAVFKPDKLKIRLRDIWMFVGTGIISIVLFNCCYFYAMIHGEASVAVVLLYTSPVFIMLISRFTFGERFSIPKIIAVILTVFGCVLVSGFLGSGHSITPLVFIIGIGSGLFYGLYSIFGKYALAKYDTLTVTVYTFIFGAAGSLPMSRVWEIGKYISSDPWLILICLGIGIFCTLMPYLLYTYGLKYAEAGKAAVLAAAEPLVGAVIGMTILGEEKNLLKIAGIALIIIAIILLNTANNGKKSNGGK